MGRSSLSHGTPGGLFGNAGNLGKAPAQRALTPRRAFMFMGTLALGLVGQDHFMDSFAAADGRIDEAHDVSPLVYSIVVKG